MALCLSWVCGVARYYVVRRSPLEVRLVVYLCFKVSKIAFGFYVYLIFQPKENSVLDMGLVTIKN